MGTNRTIGDSGADITKMLTYFPEPHPPRLCVLCEKSNPLFLSYYWNLCCSTLKAFVMDKELIKVFLNTQTTHRGSKKEMT